MLNSKDLWTGLLFIGFGVVAIAIALAGGYDIGTARKMGPGYFPIWIGGALCVIGALLALQATVSAGPPIGRFAVKPLALVTLGSALFGAIVTWLGLAPAIVLLVLIGALASSQFSLVYAVPLAVGLAAGSVLVFVKGLGLPIPVMPHVLGY